MKWLIASDIHGSAYYCKMLISRFEKENADRMLLLGDILYHGPRNSLPKSYDPKIVAESLNAIKDKIMCVRGNCDTEVDQKVLHFPILADYAVFAFENKIIYATHGHIFNKERLPLLQIGDILLYGHSHVPLCENKDGFTILNPGSVSLPKDDSWNGYMTFEDGVFCWLNLNGEQKMSYVL